MKKNESKMLSFKTETIASLSDVEQNEFVGGETFGICGYLSVLAWTACGVAGSCGCKKEQPGTVVSGNAGCGPDETAQSLCPDFPFCG